MYIYIYKNYFSYYCLLFKCRAEESEGDFSEYEISFKKPAAPKPRGRKRKSSTQGKVV